MEGVVGVSHHVLNSAEIAGAQLDTFSQRLNYVMSYKQFSQSALARMIGVKPQSIQYLCHNNAKSSRLTPQIAEALEVNLEWLALGVGKTWAEEAQNDTLVSQQVPLISWDQLTEFDPQHPAATFQHSAQLLLSDVDLGESGYALKIDNDAMSPRFEEGTVIFVDPTCQPEHKDYVIVRLANNQVVFRRLLVDGDDQYLVATHPVYKTIELKDAAYQFCGVMMQAKINRQR
jgi:SOS-response transcriptional repressor LexA